MTQACQSGSRSCPGGTRGPYCYTSVATILLCTLTVTTAHKANPHIGMKIFFGICAIGMYVLPKQIPSTSRCTWQSEFWLITRDTVRPSGPKCHLWPSSPVLHIRLHFISLYSNLKNPEPPPQVENAFEVAPWAVMVSGTLNFHARGLPVLDN